MSLDEFEATLGEEWGACSPRLRHDGPYIHYIPEIEQFVDARGIGEIERK